MKRIKFFSCCWKATPLGHLTNFFYEFFTNFFNFGKFVKIGIFFCWGNEFSIYAVHLQICAVGLHRSVNLQTMNSQTKSPTNKRRYKHVGTMLSLIKIEHENGLFSALCSMYSGPTMELNSGIWSCNTEIEALPTRRYSNYSALSMRIIELRQLTDHPLLDRHALQAYWRACPTARPSPGSRAPAT